VEFKLEVGAVRFSENPEEVEGLQFDAFQIALMCLSHINSTVELMKKGLQNRNRFVVGSEAYRSAVGAIIPSPNRLAPALPLG
jgi:hypothetical protein